MDISMKILAQGIETKCHYHINPSIMTTQILYNIPYPSSSKRHGRTKKDKEKCDQITAVERLNVDINRLLGKELIGRCIK